ncbi:hypothetical protein D9M70_591470 [compost metagenome]
MQTAVGQLSGRANGAFSGRTRVNVVIPAEAIEVHPAARVDRDRIAANYGGNVVGANVTRFDVVGHVSHLTAALPDGRTVSLEAHVDKYQPDAFPVGADILLSWQLTEATVIPA